ncbi:unnamed protein product [Boreogadus saida]
MSGSPSDACDLTLDPNTAQTQLSLSEDNRKVTVVEEVQSYPDLGREALTGRCYWEVERGGWVGAGRGERSWAPQRSTPGHLDQLITHLLKPGGDFSSAPDYSVSFVPRQWITPGLQHSPVPPPATPTRSCLRLARWLSFEFSFTDDKTVDCPY